jgi:hypothetical protein
MARDAVARHHRPPLTPPLGDDRAVGRVHPRRLKRVGAVVGHREHRGQLGLQVDGHGAERDEREQQQDHRQEDQRPKGPPEQAGAAADGRLLCG